MTQLVTPPLELSAKDIFNRSMDLAHFFGFRWVKSLYDCHSKAVNEHWCLWDKAKIERERAIAWQKKPDDGIPAEDCWVPCFYETETAKASLIRRVQLLPPQFQTKIMGHLHDTTGLPKAIKNKPAGVDFRAFVGMHLLNCAPAQMADAVWRAIQNLPREKHESNNVSSVAKNEPGGEGKVDQST